MAMTPSKHGVFVWLYLLLIPFFTYSDFIVSYNKGLYVLTFLLLLFCLSSFWQVYKQESQFFWINPYIIGSVLTFLICAGGITNWFRMGEDGLCRPAEIAPVLSSEREWYNIAMGNVCYGAFFTWIGYNTRIGKDLLKFFSSFWKNLAKVDISSTKLIFFAIVAYSAKWYLFSIGLFGRIVSNEYFVAIDGYKAGSQIRILGSLSYLTFTLISIKYFRNKTSLYKRLFFVSLSLEIFFAFIYGARGPFIVPFFIMFVTNYYIKKSFKFNYIFLLSIPLILAFTIVLEFKNYSLSSSFNRSSSPIETLASFVTYYSQLAEDKKNVATQELSNNLLGSSNVLSEASMAIRYKDIHGLDYNDPDPMLNIMMFPYNAFVPKFLQPKNEIPWGYWFRKEVLQHGDGENTTSVSISPTGFLYLAGGTSMVIFGFFVYGILLRLNYHLLFHNDMHFVLFIMLLADLFNFDSAVASLFVNITRYMTIYPFIIFLLFSKNPKIKIR